MVSDYLTYFQLRWGLQLLKISMIPSNIVNCFKNRAPQEDERIYNSTLHGNTTLHICDINDVRGISFVTVFFPDHHFNIFRKMNQIVSSPTI